jgi:4-hydroxyphenylpyruvate dioxygenase
VGGSLVYFTDPTSELARVWDIDFAPLGGTSLRAGAGLTAIDHISQSMHYQEMLTWLLFYKSLLDVDKLPEQDVLDPGGLVKSQVLQSGDGAIRLILNASQWSAPRGVDRWRT